MSVLFENWGATAAEIAAPHRADDSVDDPQFSATRSITIDATQEQVFGWLAQMGYGRAGWYSYDWIDNRGRPSATRIVDEWQTLMRGDLVPAGPFNLVARVVDRPRAMVLTLLADRAQFALGYELTRVEVGGGTGEATRLSSRVRANLIVPGDGFLARYVLGIGDGIMVRKQLLGIKRRAEATV